MASKQQNDDNESDQSEHKDFGRPIRHDVLRPDASESNSSAWVRDKNRKKGQRSGSYAQDETEQVAMHRERRDRPRSTRKAERMHDRPRTSNKDAVCNKPVASADLLDNPNSAETNFSLTSSSEPTDAESLAAKAVKKLSLAEYYAKRKPSEETVEREAAGETISLQKQTKAFMPQIEIPQTKEPDETYKLHTKEKGEHHKQCPEEEYELQPEEKRASRYKMRRNERNKIGVPEVEIETCYKPGSEMNVDESLPLSEATLPEHVREVLLHKNEEDSAYPVSTIPPSHSFSSGMLNPNQTVVLLQTTSYASTIQTLPVNVIHAPAEYMPAAQMLPPAAQKMPPPPGFPLKTVPPPPGFPPKYVPPPPGYAPMLPGARTVAAPELRNEQGTLNIAVQDVDNMQKALRKIQNIEAVDMKKTAGQNIPAKLSRNSETSVCVENEEKCPQHPKKSGFNLKDQSQLSRSSNSTIFLENQKQAAKMPESSIAGKIKEPCKMVSNSESLTSEVNKPDRPSTTDGTRKYRSRDVSNRFYVPPAARASRLDNKGLPPTTPQQSGKANIGANNYSVSKNEERVQNSTSIRVGPQSSMDKNGTLAGRLGEAQDSAVSTTYKQENKRTGYLKSVCRPTSTASRSGYLKDCVESPMRKSMYSKTSENYPPKDEFLGRKTSRSSFKSERVYTRTNIRKQKEHRSHSIDSSSSHHRSMRKHKKSPRRYRSQSTDSFDSPDKSRSKHYKSSKKSRSKSTDSYSSSHNSRSRHRKSSKKYKVKSMDSCSSSEHTARSRHRKKDTKKSRSKSMDSSERDKSKKSMKSCTVVGTQKLYAENTSKHVDSVSSEQLDSSLKSSQKSHPSKKNSNKKCTKSVEEQETSSEVEVEIVQTSKPETWKKPSSSRKTEDTTIRQLRYEPLEIPTEEVSDEEFNFQDHLEEGEISDSGSERPLAAIHVDGAHQSTSTARKTLFSHHPAPVSAAYRGNVVEAAADLFSVDPTTSLAHCVSEDIRMSQGVAVEFRKRFGRVPDLLNQRCKIGGLGVLADPEEEPIRFVYYLVTKGSHKSKPTLETLHSSLLCLKQHCQQHNVKKLAMPRVGCGLDQLHWGTVLRMLHDLFDNTETHVTIYFLRPDSLTMKRQSDLGVSSSPCKILKLDSDSEAWADTNKSLYFRHLYNRCLSEMDRNVCRVFLASVSRTADHTMQQLNIKFPFLTKYYNSPLTKGDVFRHENTVPKGVLYGLVVREDMCEPIDYKALYKALQSLSKHLKRDNWKYIGIEAHYDEQDQVVMEKLITMFLWVFGKAPITLYVCWPTLIMSLSQITDSYIR